LQKNNCKKHEKSVITKNQLKSTDVCLMWLQLGDNTGDCNILYSVLATTDVLRLQKRQLQNQHEGDCNFAAV
jgi:hypothetical protein